MASNVANVEETLTRAIYSTPIIDNHAHPLLKPTALKRYPLLSIFTEAHGDALPASQTSLAHIRGVKQLSLILGCENNWEAVSNAIQRKQQGDYKAWVQRCLSGIETILVDDGLDSEDKSEPYSYFNGLTRSSNKRIVRIEHLAARIIDEACRQYRNYQEALGAVIDNFQKAIIGYLADPAVVGFKSVICYRTGLAIPGKIDLTSATKAFQRVYDEQSLTLNNGTVKRLGFNKLNHPGLNEYFVHRLASLIRDDKSRRMKPIQFHTGLGDNDITLSTASPAHLQEFIRAYPTVPIVLLHSSYPFVREAGYLATVYANVYADIGEVFPFVSRSGQQAILRQILELCPGSKILWSTDGHWFPETYLLAVEQIRQALEVVLHDFVDKGDLSWVQAAQLVQDILFHNSNMLYGLKLKFKEIDSFPSPIGSIETGQASILARFLQGKPNPRFLRVYWNDYTASPRMKAVPMRRVWDMLRNGQDISFDVASACLGATQIDTLAQGVSSTGGYRLHPDLKTLRIGPREGHITVMGDFRDDQGLPVELCPRSLLQQTIDKASRQGLTFLLGFEIELLLLHRRGNELHTINDDGHAWAMGRIMEQDAVISVIEEAISQLDAAGVYVELVHPESTNGQFEVVLPKASPLEAVDTLLFARNVINSCATARGYRMTLHPKPYASASGTAAHVHISISSSNGSKPEIYEDFYAGILKHLRAITAFTYSNPVSYERVQDGCWAGGTWVAWGTQNREVPLRKIEDSHWEVKCIDGIANPYLALSSILTAGLRGFLDKEKLVWAECTSDPATLSDSERESLNITARLPRTLPEALEALGEDTVLIDGLGQELVARYVAVKIAETKLLDAMGEEERRQWIMKRY